MYFGVLNRLGWVETTEKTQPPAPEAILTMATKKRLNIVIIGKGDLDAFRKRTIELEFCSPHASPAEEIGILTI